MAVTMRWIVVFVLCSFALVSSVLSADETCGINDAVAVSRSGNAESCLQEYMSLNIDQYFQVVNQSFSKCGRFFTANFTKIPVDSWSQNLADCSQDIPLSMNIVIYIHLIISNNDAVLQLQSATCFKDTVTNNGDVCECRMDCLLKFIPINYDYDQFIYLTGIGCSESDLTTGLSVYNNSANIVPSIQEKPGYSECPIAAVTSSPSVVSITPTLSSSTFLSSTIIASNMPSHTLSPSSTTIPSAGTPKPTNTVCADYSIATITGTEQYCTNSCSSASVPSMYGTLLNASCASPNSFNWFISPLSANSDFDSFMQCAATLTSIPALVQLFSLSSPTPSSCVNNGGYTLTGVSCVCNSHTNCANSQSSTSTDSCVLQFTTNQGSNPSSSTVVFLSGWKGMDRERLITLVSSCSNVDLQLSNCSNGTSITTTASSIVTPVLAPTDKPKEFFSLQNTTLQLIIGMVGGVLLLIFLFVLLLVLFLAFKRSRNVRDYEPNDKRINGCVSPMTITSDTVSPFDASNTFNWTEQDQKEQTRKGSVPHPSPPAPAHLKRIDFNKWKRIFSRQVIGMNQIEVMETIGEGAFGMVQKGRLKGKNDRNILVAIKAMKDASTSEQVEDFVSESAIMLDFDHPNVLKLLGVCFDTSNGLPLIVLPYMANGDLKSFLQSKRHGTPRGSIPSGLSINLLIRMCLDIAKGMAYLARTKFVHRDLAARNCMVDENLIVRVADFGLSRDVYSKDYYRLERRVKLPVKWLPPESLHDSIFNERTDVWSFGVTCWEVFSLGRTPYPSIDNADVLEYVEKGFRLKKVPLCPKEVYVLLSQCWDESPEIRPCFLIIVESLKAILSNWDSHDSTLKKQMEIELQSLDQDGYESDTLEFDATGSMAVKIGSRARYPSVPSATRPSGRKQSQISCNSSMGLPTINSTTTLISHRIAEGGCDSPVTGGAFKEMELSTSTSEDDCRVQDSMVGLRHDYCNFTPGETSECQCCSGDHRGNRRGSTDSLDFKDSRHILHSTSDGNHSATPPNVPMFEMFYNTSNHSESVSSVVKQPVDFTGKPKQLKFRERELLNSQSSCVTELTNLPDTPMDVEPTAYSLPVKTTPIPPGDAPRRREGGPLSVVSSQGSSQSSTSHTPPPSNSRTNSLSNSGGPTVTSPSNHYYFTLEDPNCASATNNSSVFDSDSDSITPKHSSTVGKRTKTFSNSSVSDDSFHGHSSRYSDLHLSHTTPRGFNGFQAPLHVSSGRRPHSINDEELMVGIAGSTTPHHQMVLEHKGQKFECEFSP